MQYSHHTKRFIFIDGTWEKNGCHSFVICSCLCHDKYAVPTFAAIIFEDLKTEVKDFLKIEIFNDGARQQDSTFLKPELFCNIPWQRSSRWDRWSSEKESAQGYKG